MRLESTTFGLIAAALLAFSSAAHAQNSPQELTEMNRSAMDAYNNLDIETAKATLERAKSGAESKGIGGAALARTYLNLGVVYVGGYGDNGRGMDLFVQALRIDPGIQLDPIVSTPDIQQVFSLAQRKAGGGGGSAPPPRQPLPPVSDPGGAPAEGNLDHVPAVEQLSQTAVPVYVEAPADLEVEKMRIFYRSLGMQEPKSADMEQTGDGWSYLIPCTDVFEPNVEYFVMALDSDDEQVGNAGSPQNPVSVAVVSERSQPAPSLPGQIPPAQCTGSSECPPGMPGCGGGGGLGDTCRSNSECGEGLICDDNFCAIGEDDGGSSREPGDGPGFFFNVGASVGLAYVGQGMKADSTPPASVLNGSEDDAVVSAGEAIRAANGQRSADLAAGTFDEAAYLASVRDAAQIGINDAQANGWDCNANIPNAPAGTWSDPGEPGSAQAGGAEIQLTDCAVAVSTPGFVSTFAIRATAGFFVNDRVMVAATGRIQLGAGEGTLAGILVGARLGYLVTEPSADGFYTAIFGGGSFGQIQPQPKSQTGIDGPFVLGGLGGVQAGAMLGYRFTPNIGIGVTPEVHFLLPTFLFNLDISPVLNVAF